MANYYVSATTGADINNGLSIGSAKATIGAGENLATSAGDVVYIAPGTYRETVTHGYSGTSSNRIYFIGDPDCEIFTDVTPGIVRITNSDTDDVANTAASAFTVIYSNGKDYITWKNVYVDGGSFPVSTYNDSNISYGFRALYESDNMECINCMGQSLYYPFYRVGYSYNCASMGIFSAFYQGYLTQGCVGLGYYAFYYVDAIKNCITIGGNSGYLYNNDVQNSCAIGGNLAFRTYGGDTIQECTAYNCNYSFYGGTSTNSAYNGTISSSYANNAYYISNYGKMHGIRVGTARYHWINGRDPIVGTGGSTDMQGDGVLWPQAPMTLFSLENVREAAKLLGKPTILSTVLQGSTTTNFDSNAGATDYEGNPRIMGKLRGIFVDDGSGLTTSSRDLGPFEHTNIQITSSVSQSQPGFTIEDEGIFRIPLTVSASSNITASVAVKFNSGVHASIGQDFQPQLQLRYSETNTSASATSTKDDGANENLSGSNLIIQSVTKGTTTDNTTTMRTFSTISVSGSFDRQQNLELLFINQHSGSTNPSLATFSDLEIT